MKTAEWKLKRLCRRKDAKRVKRARGRGGHWTLGERLSARWGERQNIERVEAPEEIYLFGKRTHSQLARFLRTLRDSFRRKTCTVIDMTRTNRLMPGGTLLMYSELCRLSLIFPQHPFRFVRSKTDVVNQIFEHLGLFELAGFRSGVVPEREDVVSWKKCSSIVNDCQPAGELIETYESLSRDEVRQVFKGVSEAATNAVDHAYIGSRDDGLPEPLEKRWWMFSRESESTLFVGVCDLGVGIPRSLPHTFGERVQALLAQLSLRINDGSMIRAAMELKRTSTGKSERGKGLADMRTVVDKIPGSQLYIFSNSGAIRYSQGKFTVLNFDNSISGTMVGWTIPIDEASL